MKGQKAIFLEKNTWLELKKKNTSQIDLLAPGSPSNACHAGCFWLVSTGAVALSVVLSFSISTFQQIPYIVHTSSTRVHYWKNTRSGQVIVRNIGLVVWNSVIHFHVDNVFWLLKPEFISFVQLYLNLVIPVRCDKKRYNYQKKAKPWRILVVVLVVVNR